MQVNDFVAMTLEQIVEGITRAQKSVHEAGARINPVTTTGPSGRFDRETGTVFQDIEFDLAVTVEKSTKTDGELGVSAWVIKAGTGGESSTRDTTASHIRFRIPVLLPVHEGKVFPNR